ncbi:MAG: DUF1971 domain-containing protein [Endozoicomonas sp.]
MKQLPSYVSSYKMTPEFTSDTVPKGLLSAHQTKPGTWGLIVVLEGILEYRILEPQQEIVTLDRDTVGVVEPTILHEVQPQGNVRFYVEFYK